MKVKLLKKVGDYNINDEVEIEDQSVLDAWENMGVIESTQGDLSKLKVDELKALATEKELPVEEWENLKKNELVNYLSDK